MKFYDWLLRHPFLYISLMLGGLFALWLALTFAVLHPPRRDASLLLARDLLLLGNFLVILIAGIPPIAKWYTESIQRLVGSKPIAITDLVSGEYVVRNVGGSTAINVFYVRDGDQWIGLGSFTPGESRPLPTALAEHLRQPGDQRHLLLAQSRPHTGREWTVSVNVRSGEPGSPMLHAFAPPKKIDREGTIDDFLELERVRLLIQLRRAYPIRS